MRCILYFKVNDDDDSIFLIMIQDRTVERLAVQASCWIGIIRICSSERGPFGSAKYICDNIIDET